MTDLLELRDEPPSHRDGRRRGRGIGRLLAVLILLGLIAGLVLGGAALAQRVLGGTPTPDYQGQGTGSVTVQVEQGESAGEVGAMLADKGVVKSREAFFAVARDDPRATALQPGFYRLREQMSAASAFELLLDPASRLIGRVTVPEGLTVPQTLETLAKGTDVPLAQYQAAAKDTASLGLPAYAKGRLEGFLFPATYEFDPGTSAADVLRTMTARFDQAATKVGLEQGSAKLGREPYEVVIVASLIEREVKIDSEYPKVASVVYNRLDQKIPLGIDASVLYGVGKNAGGVLTKSDLARNTPYENRRRRGLPPTPIASPGEAALTAALNPASGDLLYYVLAGKDGRTLFTSDYQEFLDQKAKSQAEGLL